MKCTDLREEEKVVPGKICFTGSKEGLCLYLYLFECVFQFFVFDCADEPAFAVGTFSVLSSRMIPIKFGSTTQSSIHENIQPQILALCCFYKTSLVY